MPFRNVQSQSAEQGKWVLYFRLWKSTILGAASLRLPYRNGLTPQLSSGATRCRRLWNEAFSRAGNTVFATWNLGLEDCLPSSVAHISSSPFHTHPAFALRSDKAAQEGKQQPWEEW